MRPVPRSFRDGTPPWRISLRKCSTACRRLRKHCTHVPRKCGAAIPEGCSRAALACATIRNMQEKLTPRELEVLQLIVQGKTTKEVARLLGITFKTAACHRQRLREKTGTINAAALVLFAVQSGLVHEDRSPAALLPKR